MRESHMAPAMFTSTPISKYRKASAFSFFENSPFSLTNSDLTVVPKQLMNRQNKKKRASTVFEVFGDEKIPLVKLKKGTSFKKSASSHPPMIVISDSEEEEELFSEVMSSSNSNSSIRRNSVKINMDQPKENAKRIKKSNAMKSLKENWPETDKKNSQKRISRVDTIIDEIMKERKSTVVYPSPLVKLKSECTVDAILEEGKNDLGIRRITRSSALSSQDLKIQRENDRRLSYHLNILGRVPENKAVEAASKLQDIGNLDKISSLRRTRKGGKSVIRKEKNIKDDNEFKSAAEKTPLTLLKLRNDCVDSKKNEIIKKLSNGENLAINDKNKQTNSIPNICSRDELFNENSPVFYNQEEVSDTDWIQVNGQNGVFVKKNFRMLNISNGFVKINAKCSLLLQSVKSQIFSVSEGRGTFVYDNNITVKIGPGQTVTVPPGFACKIINSGLKKNLVLTYVKIYSE